MQLPFAALLASASLALAGVTNNADQPRDIFARYACPANNCNRAITGTRNGLPASKVRKADCSSFLRTVVTPAPVVKTTWVASAKSVKTPVTVAVTKTATAKPTYATQCSSAAAYASACSCWGITGSVSTAPVPTVFVTSIWQNCEN